MAGIDNDIALMGDCTSLNHAPPAFFSGFMSEAFHSRSIAGSSTVNGKDMTSSESEQQAIPESDSLYKMVDSGTGVQDKKRGGLAERMASRAGFSVPKLNIWQIGSPSLGCSSPSVKSPFITIPPGLSPTVLLNSPIVSSILVDAQVVQNNTHSDEVPVQLEVKNEEEKKGKHDIPAWFLEIPLHSDFSKYSEWVTPSNDSKFTCQTLNVVTDTKQISNNVQMQLEDQKVEICSTLGHQEEDGYNWRKYGQKQVKGSEYPRSYYKCTHTDCPVKKIVERSQEGNITDVTYKGVHNHPKPPINRRTPGLLASQSLSDNRMESSEHGPENSMVVLTSSRYSSGGLDEGSKPSSSVSLTEESCDPLSAAMYPFGRIHDSMDITPTISNEEDDADQATYNNLSTVDGGEGDELESKRRKMDCSLMDSCSAPTREPRVVVQTTSEVDILDDGYRWRKYGQKVVKGNPNPRSYYKCTSSGCNVRKHVERASHDLKSVITTYEGKHNHEVPIARSSNHGSAAISGNSTTSTFLQSQRETKLLELPRAEDAAMIREPHEAEAKHGRSTSAFALNISAVPQHLQPNIVGVSSFRLGQFDTANLLMYGFNYKPMAEANLPVNTFLSYNFENIVGPVVSSGESMLGRIPMSNTDFVYRQMLSGLQLDLGH